MNNYVHIVTFGGEGGVGVKVIPSKKNAFMFVFKNVFSWSMDMESMFCGAFCGGCRVIFSIIGLNWSSVTLHRQGVHHDLDAIRDEYLRLREKILHQLQGADPEQAQYLRSELDIINQKLGSLQGFSAAYLQR